MISRLKPEVTCRSDVIQPIYRPRLKFPESTGKYSGEIVITEVDKLSKFNNILREDEIAILGEDKNRLFSFDLKVPHILSRMLKMKQFIPDSETNSGNNLPTDKEVGKLIHSDVYRDLLIGRRYATFIDTVIFPKYCNVEKGSYDFKVSTFPLERKAEFIFLNKDEDKTFELEQVDILPIIKSYPKCLTAGELIERLIKRYEEESERETLKNLDERSRYYIR